jgi:tripartite-type tricarboxylate transporter receptor subunit TctC
MERGEVEGRGTNPYSGWMASKPTWIPQKLIIPLIQAGVEKEPALPDVPLIVDQPVKPEDRPLLGFMAQSSAVGRPFATTPGVPPERVAALRAAFAATVKDPELLAAAAQENMEIRPMTGEKLHDIIVGLLGAPQDVRERMKIALQPKDEHTVEKK